MTEIQAIEELDEEEAQELLDEIENGEAKAYLGDPAVSDLEPGDHILFETEEIEATEAAFLGTTHGLVRLKGIIPGEDEEVYGAYKVGEKAIHILGADRLT